MTKQFRIVNIKLAIILGVAFVARLFSIFWLNRHINPEVWEYDEIALNLLQNKGYIINYLGTSYKSLGYPFYALLSACFHFFSGRNYFILELFQILISTLSCFLVYLIAKRIFSERTGLLASFLAATHPGLIVYSTKIHELTLVSFLILFIFWIFLYLNLKKIWVNVLIGSLIGIGVLTRPVFIFFLPVYLVYLCLKRNKLREIFKIMSVVIFCFFLFVVPWTVRNYRVHKRLIFIATTQAEMFWRGNNPLASGSSLTQDGTAIIATYPVKFRDMLFKMNELEQHDFFYKEAFKFIKDNPSTFLKLTLNKFIYFWWFSPQTGKLYPGMWTQIYKAYYILLFLFFIWGCYLSFANNSVIDKKFVSLIMFFTLLVSFLHSVYYCDIRHRWMIESLMIIIASFGASALFERANQVFKRT